MKWNILNNNTQLEEIKKISEEQPVVVFKHSTRCSISATALNRLERNWKEEEMSVVKPYFLDLLSYRPVSNAIAETFGVHHQSPQILVIHKGACVYHTSHMDISYPGLKAQLSQLNIAA
jgi:bacillithiol system protein YtxJ